MEHFRWQMHHKDFVKYAFCHCNMRDNCRQAELYNICHLFLHIIFDFLLKIPLDNHLQACIITNAVKMQTICKCTQNAKTNNLQFE